MQSKPVAIIGMGAVFPKAPNLKDFWRLILNGRDAVTEVPETHWSPAEYFNEDRDLTDHLYCKRGGFLSPYDFDPAEFGIPPANLDATDTSQLLGLVAANMALENAGYGKSAEFSRERASVILGVTGTQELVIPLSSRLSHPRWHKAMQLAGIDDKTAADVMEILSDSYVKWQENSFPGLLGNVVAGRISNRLDLRGTNCVVDAACASSLAALHLALLELESHKNDMIITGGVDTLNDVFMHMCFCKTGVLSPTGDIRPFAGNADGTVLGEGIGMLVLKRLEDAVRDHDNIYAVIKSMGSSSDGKAQSIYAPTAQGQERALRNAYELADVPPETVGLIEGHGTGTLVGDKVEVSALQAVFSNAGPQQTSIGSVKALVGHTKAAAGSAGIIKAALALYNKVLPPSIKIEPPNQILDDSASPFYLNVLPRPWVGGKEHPRRAGVSAFGFGGSNFHAVLEEYRPQKRHISWDNTTQILAFSADDPAVLQTQIKQFQDMKLTRLDAELAHAAMQTRKNFQAEHELRLLIMLDEAADIDAYLTRALEITHQAMPQTADNIFFGHGTPEGDLAFLFPGQGSQYPHMGYNYATRFPQALTALELFDKSFEASKALSDYIYPAAAFNDEARKVHFAELTRTEVAQPALGAVSLGMLEALRYFGVTPAFVMGHSFGELSALHAAGWLNYKDYARMSAMRGEAVRQAGATGAPGAMLAVYAAADALADLLNESGLDVCIANLNAGNQTVLAGGRDDIRKMAELLRKRNLKCTQLQVSGAFHSKFVASACDYFNEKTRDCALTPSSVKVVSNVTGGFYPADATAARELLCRQIASPVNFMGGLETLYNQGARSFVEVGPKTVLSALANTVLADKDVNVLSIDKSRGRNELKDLAETLCCLAAEGRKVDLALWEEDVPKPRAKVMHVPLCGANFGPKEVTWNDDKPRPPKAALPKRRQADNPPPVRPASIPAKPVDAPAMKNVAKPQTTVNYEQTQSKQVKIMNNNKNLDIFEKSLNAISQLQEQVTRAHEKFLDTQAEANRTLQSMLQTMSGGQPLPAVSRPAASPIQLPVTAPTVSQPVDIPASPILQPTAQVPAAPAPTLVQTPTTAVVTPVAAKTNVTSALLEVVSELTGYPAEMLQLDMQIESDLGIDSIKRVEILSTLEERLPSLPQTDPEEMAALKTLGEIAAKLDNGAPLVQFDIAAPPTPTGASALQTTNDDIMPGLLAVVSELTGYPVEMLQPEMQLESDLGIDSIKRVEILSTLEERLPNLPQTDPEEMASLKTLGEIAAVLGAGTSAIPMTAPPTAVPAANPDVTGTLMTVVGELAGYPVEMLQPEMQLESDLGIDSIKRVEILSTLEERLPNLPQTDPEEMAALKTLGEIIAALSAENLAAAAPPVLPVATVPTAATIPAPATESASPGEIPQRRVIKLQDLPHLSLQQINLTPGQTILLAGTPSPLIKALAAKIKALGAQAQIIAKKEIAAASFDKLQGLIIFSESKPEDEGADLLLNFEAIQHVGPALQAGEKPFIIGISQLDGAFGFGRTQSVNAAAAGLAGIIKTLRIEWPQVNCRMVDLAPGWTDTVTQADAILAEADQTDGLETGLSAKGRVKLNLELTNLPELDLTAFAKDDVFIITGGARGVTARAAISLSRTFQPRLALLGRSPMPFKEPAWLATLESPGDIKKAILVNDFKDQTPAPKEVEARYRNYMANREINANLAQMCALGANAKYYSVDILDKTALQTAYTDIKADMGKVTALVHGAGVLEDKLLLDKTPEQFRKVYTTKVAGLNNLLEVCRNETLKAVALFSSVTARMGNKGQCDYAAANEILNKTAQNLALENPALKAVAFNWGPWDGGMVSAALKKEFAEYKVDLIDMQGGAEAFVRELSAANGPVEVVFGSGFEALLPQAVQHSATTQTVTAGVPQFKSLFDLTISPQNYPVLASHVIGGNYVVPFALSLEWLAHAALYENPGLVLKAINNARIFKGLVIPQGHTAEVSIFGTKPVAAANGDLTVNVEIRARINDKSFTHAGAQIAMGTAVVGMTKTAPQSRPASYSLSAAQVYDQVLFHGALLQGLQQITVCDTNSAEALSACLSKPRDFVTMPLRNAFLTEPLVIDCAFQLASLWCHENHKMVSLPGDFGTLKLYGKFQAGADIRIILNVTAVKGNIMQGDFCFCDNSGNVVAEIKSFRAVMNPSLNQAFKPHLKIAV